MAVSMCPPCPRPPVHHVPGTYRDARSLRPRRPLSAHDHAHDFVAAAAVLDVAEAQAIGHGDAAAVGIECALRIDLQITLPVESPALVTNRESKLTSAAFERHFCAFGRVFGHR